MMRQHQFIHKNERENKSALIRNVLSFSVGIIVIFFADAKSDISLTGSDIARLRLAVIFYSPKNSRSEYHSARAEYNCVAIELAAGE